MGQLHLNCGNERKRRYIPITIEALRYLSKCHSTIYTRTYYTSHLNWSVCSGHPAGMSQGLRGGWDVVGWWVMRIGCKFEGSFASRPLANYFGRPAYPSWNCRGHIALRMDTIYNTLHIFSQSSTAMNRNPENTTPKQPLRKKIGCKHPRLRIPWKQHRWISQTFAVRDGARQAFWAMISRKQNWIRSFEIERRRSRRSPSFFFLRGGGIVWNPGKCQSFMELDWWNGCCHCFPDPVLPQFARCGGPIPGQMIQFDQHIFQMGVSTTNY